MSVTDVRKLIADATEWRPEAAPSYWPAPIDLRAMALREPQPPQWIVRDWLPAGYATLMAGHGGTGKSAIALQLAACMAMGRPWAGLDVERRRVLYLSAEDREDAIHWRLAAICQHIGARIADLHDRLHVLDVVGRDAVLWSSRQTDDTPAMAALSDAMDATRAEVLIVDGVSDTFGGNEILRAEVGAYVTALTGLISATRGAVLLVAHVDKATARGTASGQGYSGSTAWNNKVRARWELAAEKQQDDTGDASGDLILTLAKANLGRTGASMRWTWDDDARLFTGRPIVPATALDRAARDRREREGVLAAMRAVISAGDYVPAAMTGNRTAFHVLQARPEFPDMPATAAGRKRFRAVIEALRAMGEIQEASITRSDYHKVCTLVPVSPTGSHNGHTGNA